MRDASQQDDEVAPQLTSMALPIGMATTKSTTTLSVMV
jgi:hypothetical protein